MILMLTLDQNETVTKRPAQQFDLIFEETIQFCVAIIQYWSGCFRHQMLLGRQRYSPGSQTDQCGRVEQRE
jgi:hypothetical protein